jgi:uncharacterized membrane protein
MNPRSTPLTASDCATAGDGAASGRSSSRRGYIDWLRGFAILIMIETHVLDAWTRNADRNSVIFGYAKVLGGFAAPLFLFLAGIAVVFATRAQLNRTGDPALASRAVQRRGWQIFGLAFLFRFQAWILNPLASPGQMLKVDILNIMGPAIVMAAVLCGIARERRARLVVFGAAAALMTFATPLVRATPLLAVLPDAVEAYLRPVPGYNSFNLFPWAGFVFAGSLVGVVLDRPRDSTAAIALHAWFAIGGLACAVASYYAWYLPSPYASTDFWTSSPTFFFMRTAILVAAVGVTYFPQSAPPFTALGRAQPMQRFGRSSLFVYWIHVELAYGVLSRRVYHRLPIDDAVVAFVLFSALMFGVVVVKDRLKDKWKRRGQGQAQTGDLVAAS